MDDLTREQAARRLTDLTGLRGGDGSDVIPGVALDVLALRMGAEALAEAAEVAERGRPTRERIRALAAEVDNVRTDVRYRAPVAELAVIADDLLTRVTELEAIVRAFVADRTGDTPLSYGEWGALILRSRRALDTTTPANGGTGGGS